MMDDPFKEYKQQKKKHADQNQPMSQEQRLKQELRQLPKGKALMNWISQHLANRLFGDTLMKTRLPNKEVGE